MKTLDKTERQVLLRKYMSNGDTFQEALAKVNLLHDRLKIMRDELRSQGKSDKDIENKFREEFEKLCCSLER